MQRIPFLRPGELFYAGGRSLKPVRMRVDEGKSKRFAFRTDDPELVCDISRLKVPRSGVSRRH